MSFLFKRKDFGFWYIGYYDESGKMKKISTTEKLKTRADIVHDNFKKKKTEISLRKFCILKMCRI